MIYDLPVIIITADPSDLSPVKTSKKIQENQVPDIPEISDIPGISDNPSNTTFFKTSLSSLQAQNSAHITNMGIGQTISLRGFGDNAPSDILITYNGIPLNTTSLSGANLNLIPLSLIQSYSLNPYSSSEQNSIGGSVSFNTQTISQTISQNNLNNNSPDSLYLSFSQPIPFNLNHSNQLNHPLQNFSLSETHDFYPGGHAGPPLHGSSFNDIGDNTVNQIKIFTFNNFINTQRDFEQTNISQFGLQTLHQSQNNSTQFFIQAGPEQDQYPGALTLNQVNQNRHQIGSYPGDFNSQNLLTSFISNTQILNYLNAQITLTHQNQNGQGTWYTNTNTNNKQNLIPQSTYTENTQSSSINPQITFSQSNYFLTFSEDLTQATYSNTYNQIYNANSQDINLNNAHQISANSGFNFKKIINSFWQVNTGANQIFAHQSDPANTNNLTNTSDPKISLWHLNSLFKINAFWDLKLSREGSYRLPLVDENSDSLPNAQLVPETSTDYSATLRFKNKNFFQSSLELYQLNTQHEISYIPANSNNLNNPSPFGANINLPKTKRQGVILNTQENLNSYFQFNPSLPWVFSQSLSLMRNHLANTNNNIPWTSPLLFSFNNSIFLTPKFSWDLNLNYTGKLYASGDINNQGGTFGQYLLINTNFNYLINSWTLSFSILNLTNHHYFNYVSYSPTGDGYYPADGISGLITASLNL